MTGSRDINSETIAASAASRIDPVLFAKLEFDAGTVFVHTELGNLTFGGDTYTGVGTFGSIDQADEVSDLSSTPLSLTLSNIPGDMGSIVLNEQYQGRTATIFLGYLDPTTRQLVADPTILYRGRMDTADIQQDQTFTVTISVASRFTAWNQPLTRRYNDADQQSRFPGDKGMQFIEQTVNKTIVWGAPA